MRALAQPDAKAFPDLFVWTDTCTVYVLRDGDAALLIDLGDGSVLDRLRDIGVTRVEWVLFTHHHREQCQGAPRLKGSGAKVAAPEGERALFERPAEFRKMKVRLGDALTIHGSSYVRPPIQPIALDRALEPGETFRWRGLEFACLGTPGNSPAGMTYQLQLGGRRLAFSGDVMLDGARMHTWFDSEWDYGFGAGIRALQKSVKALADSDPAWLLPSHGPVVRDPKPQLREYGEKLLRLEKLYLRGYGVEHASTATQDKVSKPTAVPDVVQVLPHLFKFKRKDFWPNFGLILADSGRALVVDCGLLDVQFLDASLEGLRRHFGLKAIDAVIITHMHGDHFLEAPHLREKWGAKIWALDNMVDKMEHPERFDYAAPIQSYGRGFDSVTVDRGFKPGETFEWEGYRFTVDWMPGQTEFALCLHGQIDGRKVAFTGDNIFGDPEDPAQTGHEAVVAHNSGILEEGYIYAAEYLHRLKPDLLIGGHSFVMDRPAAFIERYRKWSYAMRDAFQSLSSDSDYRYGFDPFWVRAEPYRTVLRPGQGAEVAVHVRNFRKTRQAHRIEIHTPPGILAEPAVLEGELDGEARGSFPIRVRAVAGAAEGVRIVALDVTLDGHRYGQRFDLVIGIDPADAARQQPDRLTVALAQPLVVPGAVETNVRNMEPLIVESARRGADLVVFSECGMTGYDLKGVGAAAAVALDDPALDKVAAMAKANGVAIVAGLTEKRAGKLHNTAVVFYPDGRRVVQRKHRVLSPEKDAAPIVPAGRKREIFELKGFRMAVAICSDSGIPGLHEELARAGCDAIIVPTAGAGDESFGFHRAALADPAVRARFVETATYRFPQEAIARALRLGLAEIACNQAGWDGRTGYYHPGGSSILDRTGELTAIIPPHWVFEDLREELALGTISRGTREP